MKNKGQHQTRVMLTVVFKVPVKKLNIVVIFIWVLLTSASGTLVKKIKNRTFLLKTTTF